MAGGSVGVSQGVLPGAWLWIDLLNMMQGSVGCGFMFVRSRATYDQVDVRGIKIACMATRRLSISPTYSPWTTRSAIAVGFVVMTSVRLSSRRCARLNRHYNLVSLETVLCLYNPMRLVRSTELFGSMVIHRRAKAPEAVL